MSCNNLSWKEIFTNQVYSTINENPSPFTLAWPRYNYPKCHEKTEPQKHYCSLLNRSFTHYLQFAKYPKPIFIINQIQRCTTVHKQKKQYLFLPVCLPAKKLCLHSLLFFKSFPKKVWKIVLNFFPNRIKLLEFRSFQ